MRRLNEHLISRIIRAAVNKRSLNEISKQKSIIATRAVLGIRIMGNQHHFLKRNHCWHFTQAPLLGQSYKTIKIFEKKCNKLQILLISAENKSFAKTFSNKNLPKFISMESLLSCSRKLHTANAPLMIKLQRKQ